MIKKFLTKSVNLADQQGSTIVFFLLVLLSASLILIGLVLKKIEHEQFSADSRLTNELLLIKERVALENEKIDIERDKAQIKIDGIVAHHKQQITKLRDEFQSQFDDYKSKTDEKVSEWRDDFQTEVTASKDAYEQSLKSLHDARAQLLLDAERLRSKAVEGFLQASNSIVIEFQKRKTEIEMEAQRLHHESNERLWKGEAKARQQSVALAYLNEEVLSFLDELQKDIETIETTLKESDRPNVQTNLSKFVVTRIKLSAFLGEYRDRIRRASMPSNALFGTVVTGKPVFDTGTFKNAPVPSILKVTPDLPNSFYPNGVILPKNMDITLPDGKLIMPEVKPSPSGNLGAAARLPNISLGEVASLDGLAKAAHHGYLWIYLVSSGGLVFAYSLMFGYTMITARPTPTR